MSKQDSFCAPVYVIMYNGVPVANKYRHLMIFSGLEYAEHVREGHCQHLGKKAEIQKVQMILQPLSEED